MYRAVKLMVLPILAGLVILQGCGESGDITSAADLGDSGPALEQSDSSSADALVKGPCGTFRTVWNSAGFTVTAREDSTCGGKPISQAACNDLCYACKSKKPSYSYKTKYGNCGLAKGYYSYSLCTCTR